MKIAKRLGDAARTTVRAGRGLVGGSTGQGDEAVYARILDGRHLWLAVAADAGRPGLWDEQAGHEVEVVDDLSGYDDHAEHDDSCVSVRWRLEGALAEQDGAELLVVTTTEDGETTPARHPLRAPGGKLRIPPTPDRRWRFALPPRDDGLLRVRRTRAADVAVLDEIRSAGAGVRLVCTTEREGEVRLLFVTRDGGVAHAVPLERDGTRCEATVHADDLPAAQGRYRVAMGTADEHLDVVRRDNDLVVEDPSDVLLPLVLGGDGDADVAGRFQFAKEGVLRLIRPGAGDDAASAGAP